MSKELPRCSRCSKLLLYQDESGKEHLLVAVTINLDCGDPSFDLALQHNMGKYYKPLPHQEFLFCWECWLNSLFGK